MTLTYREFGEAVEKTPTRYVLQSMAQRPEQYTSRDMSPWLDYATLRDREDARSAYNRAVSDLRNYRVVDTYTLNGEDPEVHFFISCE